MAKRKYHIKLTGDHLKMAELIVANVESLPDVKAYVKLLIEQNYTLFIKKVREFEQQKMEEDIKKAEEKKDAIEEVKPVKGEDDVK